MVYNAVAQTDLEVASKASSASGSSRSSSLHAKTSNTFQRVPLPTENMGGGSHMEHASTADDSSLKRLGSMIRSMADTSYDRVEEDDYELADPSRRSNSLRHLPRLDTSARSPSPDPLLRSPTTDHPVPLSHPTPDLQSLQGAYVGNVERLERSAECLSSSSADIGSEIRKMDQEQKKRSCSSASNSIVTRVSDFSSTGPTSLVHGPAHGVSRLRPASSSHLAQITEPEYEQSYGELPDRTRTTPTLPPLQTLPFIQNDSFLHGQNATVVSGHEVERPSTAASNDTFQQAKTLFTDFDGVHFISHESGHESLPNVSLTKPPLATGSESHKEPHPGESMVYYPAPVPRMLNLPPRLSRRPIAEREKRRNQLLDSVPLENRKSAPWLSGQNQEEEKNNRQSQIAADLPAHLRASVFFEQPSASVNIEANQSSAVATLDSILEASAHAPVTAFTDHPFAGHLGSEVYGRSKQKSGLKDPTDQKKKRQSRNKLVSRRYPLHEGHEAGSAALGESEDDAGGVHEPTSLRNDASDDVRSDYDESSAEENTSDDRSWSGDQEPGDEDEDPGYVGPPNTLLAELQLRKQELKQRSRTAANSAGLHSTLLELDAVAQKQSEHRRQKRITLAWESPDLDKPEDDDNEDVPLAMLYPDKANLSEGARPLGLMEKRELEDAEPLSRRRARLRGEAPVDRPVRLKTRASTMDFQHPAEPVDSDSGDEGETLGQRLKRMKAQNRPSMAAESEFATEVLAEISHVTGDAENDEKEGTAQETETLAQRRARLQWETKVQHGIDPKVHKSRKSMAELSQIRPASGTLQAASGPAEHRNPMGPYPNVYENRMSMPAHSHYDPMPAIEYPQGPGYATTNPHSYTINHPNTFYSDAILGMNNLAYTMSGSYAKGPEPVVNSGQREIIDRWRQSIM